LDFYDKNNGPGESLPSLQAFFFGKEKSLREKETFVFFSHSLFPQGLKGLVLNSRPPVILDFQLSCHIRLAQAQTFGALPS